MALSLAANKQFCSHTHNLKRTQCVPGTTQNNSSTVQYSSSTPDRNHTVVLVVSIVSIISISQPAQIAAHRARHVRPPPTTPINVTILHTLLVLLACPGRSKTVELPLARAGLHKSSQAKPSQVTLLAITNLVDVTIFWLASASSSSIYNLWSWGIKAGVCEQWHDSCSVPPSNRCLRGGGGGEGRGRAGKGGIIYSFSSLFLRHPFFGLSPACERRNPFFVQLRGHFLYMESVVLVNQEDRWLPPEETIDTHNIEPTC